jgi:uncharacterized membrane protein
VLRAVDVAVASWWSCGAATVLVWHWQSVVLDTAAAAASVAPAVAAAAAAALQMRLCALGGRMAQLLLRLLLQIMLRAMGGRLCGPKTRQTGGAAATGFGWYWHGAVLLQLLLLLLLLLPPLQERHLL